MVQNDVEERVACRIIVQIENGKMSTFLSFASEIESQRSRSGMSLFCWKTPWWSLRTSTL